MIDMVRRGHGLVPNLCACVTAAYAGEPPKADARWCSLVILLLLNRTWSAIGVALCSKLIMLLPSKLLLLVNYLHDLMPT